MLARALTRSFCCSDYIPLQRVQYCPVPPVAYINSAQVRAWMRPLNMSLPTPTIPEGETLWRPHPFPYGQKRLL